jgi:hypothetical protein
MISERERIVLRDLVLLRHTLQGTAPKKATLQAGSLESKLENIKSKSDLMQEVYADLLQATRETREKLNIQVEKERKSTYAFILNYQETESEETVTVEAEDEDQKKYQFSITKKKPIPEPIPYKLNISYKLQNQKEELSITYELRDYPKEREEAQQDFTSKLDKTLHIMPKSLMGGILGFTYLGENFMARREDLIGETANMVDVHEAIHTTNEYETRILTEWMLSKVPPKYKK